MKQRYALWFAFYALCLCSCASVKGIKIPVLYGMIYDQENKAVNGANIYLNGKYVASSDINGHFALNNINTQKHYSLLINKVDYEELNLDLMHADPSLVLYVQMSSSEQLIARAEAAFRSRDWGELDTFLSRAENAGGDALSIGYLRALQAFYNNDYSGAMAVLEDLSKAIHDSAFLYLFMADLYQYYLDDPRLAVLNLERFLGLRYDAEAEARLAGLR
ncbi:MAG: carboxypeptidase regulatory-like domain-containing protein [Treponema sp.]|nr:carboxypeptidase regulatory-like domain-containing protein [Treponema sp.]